jgi:PAS domain S-box-containing protein
MINMLSHSLARNSPDDPSLSAGHLNGEQWQPLLHLFDFLPVGIYWATPEGQIVKANSALACMLGYLDCNMLLSVNVVDLYVHVEDRQRELALLKHPGDLCVSEIQLRHHNGSALWGQSMITAVQKAEGQELYHLGLVENLTK